MGKSDGAILALQFFAAGAAEYSKRISAPVEQDDGLLATIDSGLCPLQQNTGKDALLPGLLELEAHINQVHHRQWPLVDPLRHLNQRIFSRLRIAPGL